jgi:hypothetical protein
MIKIENDGDLRSAANGGHVANSNGYDISFRASDGTTQLDHEIEKYDGSAGTLIAWVRIPVLDFDDNTTIYLYYGNSNVTSPTENPGGVWDSNYMGVWHLKEDAPGTGITDLYKDSAGTNHGADLVSDTGQSGQIGAGQDFDGNDDYVSTNNMNLSGTNAVSLSFWMKKSSFAPLEIPFEFSADTNSYTDGFGMYIDSTSTCATTEIEMHIKGNVGNDNHCFASPSVDVWHHYVAIYNKGATSPESSLYIDGAVQTATSNPYTADNTNNFGDRPFYMMARGGSALFGTGPIDEVRISNAVRDDCWIETEFSNQGAPSSS